MSLAYSQKDAAAQLGLSVNHFKEHVRPELPVVYVGGLRRWAASDLQKWLDKRSTTD